MATNFGAEIGETGRLACAILRRGKQRPEDKGQKSEAERGQTVNVEWDGEGPT